MNVEQDRRSTNYEAFKTINVKTGEIKCMVRRRIQV